MSRRPAVRVLACIAAILALQTINVLLVAGLGWPLWAAAGLTGTLGLLLALLARRYFRRDSDAKPSRRLKRVLLWGAGVYGVLVVAGTVAWALMFVLADPISGDLDLVRSDKPGLRVLFVGNTLTSDNGMTSMLNKIAERDPGARPVFAVQYARRRSTLDKALDDRRLRNLLDDEHWDYVVLQEHSQVASSARGRRADMLPAAVALIAMARQTGATPVLFETWGYKDGDDHVSGDSYEAMQSRLIAGYHRSERALGAVVAPVGEAWRYAVRQSPALDLWASNGIRPNRVGSYLAASVLYTVLEGRTPRRIAFTGGLRREWARYLTEVASYTLSYPHP